MQLIIYNKNTVIFIHGFRKHYNDWNITAGRGPPKSIRIEERIRQNNNTVLVGIDEEDYKQPISNISEIIYAGISELLSTSITIVTHSYGSFYAFYLAEKYQISKLLLIEPVVPSVTFFTLLKERANDKNLDSVECYKVNNFNMYPTGKNIKSRVIVRIHLNVNGDKISDITEFSALTNKNIKSRLIIHYKSSHMIHYTKPDIIYDSITELLAL